MFTGIIEEKGSIKHINVTGTSGNLAVQCKKVLCGTKVGDSIAVNGVCLTVTSIQPDGFSADIMAQTVRMSSLGRLGPKSHVNLERAMAANGRFGGHIVSGHIDGTGTVIDRKQEENAIWFTISAEPGVLFYIVDKGSITIDGISLTVAYVDESCFKVSVIPHTILETTLADTKIGDTVNLENDIIGKYVEKLLGVKMPQESSKDNPSDVSNITMEYLLEQGF